MNCIVKILKANVPRPYLSLARGVTKNRPRDLFKQDESPKDVDIPTNIDFPEFTTSGTDIYDFSDFTNRISLADQLSIAFQGKLSSHDDPALLDGSLATIEAVTNIIASKAYVSLNETLTAE